MRYPNCSRLLAWVAFVLVPALASAQGSITGVVRDTSGAVLPGVTVEATSPALIEKARVVVTDGTGQYRIVELRPGTYTVTFTLPGFSVVRRGGIEIAGTFTATANAELRVGTLEETVTVTGETAIVDVQSATRQAVLSQEVIETIPSGRTHMAAAVLLPGVGTGSIDVGGTNTINLLSLSVHGSRATDQRVNIEGLNIANADGGGQHTATIPNMGAVQELTIDTGGGTAEQSTGGLTINVIPREGGNTFQGSFFATGFNDSFQGSNYTQELKDRGMRSPTSIKMNYDINPSFGGPVIRDKLWLFTTARWMRYENYAGDIFYNKNEGHPTNWKFYEPDLSRRGYFGAIQRSVLGRLTWQANSINKISVSYDDQYRLWSPRVYVNVAPDAATDLAWPMQRNLSATWTAPVTNRLLLEAGTLNRGEAFQYRRPPEGDARLDRVPILEQSTGVLYGAPCCEQGSQPYMHNFSHIWNLRGSASYVTGAHAFKTGVTLRSMDRQGWLYDNNHHMTWRFNNGIPNQLTQRATPVFRHDRNPVDLALFAQERWTLGQLTLNAGVRFDYYTIVFPEGHLGPAPLVPDRDISYPRTEWVNWKDITPRLAAAYDVFGSGRTAIKVSLNKYMVGGNIHTGVLGGGSNPVNAIANFVTRSWNDANRNYWPDCDLRNVGANGECGPTSDRNFGKPIPTLDVDPDARIGWGRRPYNWELTTSVQHEILPQVSMDVGYFRRWYGNFSVTDNRAITAADFDPFSVTAPSDSRLPGGGGYVISGLYNLNPAKFGQVGNFVTLARTIGKQTEHWNGVDVSINVRPQRGFTFTSGVSTGRTTTDECDIRTKLDDPSPLYCRVQTALLTQVKFFGSYMIPRMGVQLGATFQSFPGPEILANVVFPNAAVAPSLGRNLTGSSVVTVNVVEPGTMYGDRLNQLDLRVGKTFSLGPSRTALNLDIYNALNTSAVTSLNNSFAVWQRPNTTIMARFFKLSVQIDF